MFQEDILFFRRDELHRSEARDRILISVRFRGRRSGNRGASEAKSTGAVLQATTEEHWGRHTDVTSDTPTSRLTYRRNV